MEFISSCYPLIQGRFTDLTKQSWYSCGCSSASEVTLNKMGKIALCLVTAKQNKVLVLCIMFRA